MSRPKRLARLPLGYVWNSDGHGGLKVALDPERAPAIRKAFEKVASGKWTVQRAYLWLHYEVEMTTLGGCLVSEVGVKRMMASAPFNHPEYSKISTPNMLAHDVLARARIAAINHRVRDELPASVNRR